MKAFTILVLLLSSIQTNAQIKNGIYKCKQDEIHYSGRNYLNYILAVDSQNIILYGWDQDYDNCSDTTYYRCWIDRSDYEHFNLEYVECSRKSYFEDLSNFKKDSNIKQNWPAVIFDFRLRSYEKYELIYLVCSPRGSACDEVDFEFME